MSFQRFEALYHSHRRIAFQYAAGDVVKEKFDAAGLYFTLTEEFSALLLTVAEEMVHKYNSDFETQWKLCEKCINTLVVQHYYSKARWNGYSDAWDRCKQFLHNQGRSEDSVSEDIAEMECVLSHQMLSKWWPDIFYICQQPQSSTQGEPRSQPRADRSHRPRHQSQHRRRYRRHHRHHPRHRPSYQGPPLEDSSDKSYNASQTPDANGQANLYKILDLPRSASKDDIKKAHRKLTLKHHPDRNYGNEAKASEQMKMINVAKEVLTDAKKKASYDRTGSIPRDRNS